ncbi:MAG: class I SAM-dependent methyltransferase [Chloroflexi bacterium]|nr:class I SAM-dependent methyltransferase [Chloroflexota bacterium]
MSSRRSRDELLKRFSSRYAEEGTSAGRLVERCVIGANVGVNGYTTVAQADRLVEALDLSPESRLLDLGSGRGWPGLHVAALAECHVVLTDVPEAAVRSAQRRSAGATDRVSLARASATHLPFAARSFDAICHADTL